MKQYIDKNALIAKIERLISNAKPKLQESQESNDEESYVEWVEHIATCIRILSLINTLEVKESPIDSFIKKAWEWVEDNILSSNQQDKSLLYYEQFKKYVKGE